MTHFRSGTSGKIIPAATPTNDGFATAAQISKLDSIAKPTANAVPIDGLQTPFETLTISAGIAVTNGRTQRDRRTELDHFVLGEQGASSYTKILLKEATVICPLFGRDRYLDPADSLLKSRNFGSLGGGIILGTNTQLPYTAGQRGCRLLASAAGMIQLPAAWIDPDGAFTILIRYQRPAGVTNYYSSLLQIGDVGGSSASGRIWIRTLETDILQSSVGLTTLPASSYSPRVVCITAAAGAGGAVKIFTDGYPRLTGVKGAGTLSGKNHALGGTWLSGSPQGYAHWNILDVIILPREISAGEVPWLTRTVQHFEHPVVDLLTGQSNMFGPGNVNNGEPVALPTPLPNARVVFTDESIKSTWTGGFGACNVKYDGSFGPELSICAARPERTYVKYARNGTGSSGWIGVSTTTSLELAEALMAPFAELSCRPVVRNFVFRQGETDAETPPETMTPEYRRDQLLAVAAQIRTGFNESAATLRVVLPRIPAALAAAPSILSLDNVRAGDALFVASDPNAVLVDIDSCPVRAGDLHNTNQGVLDVGTLCAAQMQS